MHLSYITSNIIYIFILIHNMFSNSSTLNLVSFSLFFPSLSTGFCSHSSFFPSFQLKVVLYFVVQWSALPSCLLGGLSILRSIYWTILVNTLFSYPVLLCLSCFQYRITIFVCLGIAVQSVIVFDYDYVFLNVLKQPGYPFLGFMDYFYKTMMFYTGLRFCLQTKLCRIFDRFSKLENLEIVPLGWVSSLCFFKRTMIS